MDVITSGTMPTVTVTSIDNGVVQYEVSAYVSDNNPSSSDTDDDSVNAALDTIIPRWDWIGPAFQRRNWSVCLGGTKLRSVCTAPSSIWKKFSSCC